MARSAQKKTMAAEAVQSTPTAEVTVAQQVSGEDVVATTPDPAPQLAERKLAPPTVVVTGPRQGRWRIGRHFGAEPTVLSREELTEAQFAALCGDALLSVRVIDAPY